MPPQNLRGWLSIAFKTNFPTKPDMFSVLPLMPAIPKLCIRLFMVALIGIRQCTAIGCWCACSNVFPALPEAKEIRQLLEQNLTQENIAAEVRYFSQPLNRSFERTYGWAWLLKLAEELHDWPDTDAMRWCANLQPLADLLVQRYQDFLSRQTYPIRTGGTQYCFWSGICHRLWPSRGRQQFCLFDH
jgi:hypothetical protein